MPKDRAMVIDAGRFAPQRKSERLAKRDRRVEHQPREDRAGADPLEAKVSDFLVKPLDLCVGRASHMGIPRNSVVFWRVWPHLARIQEE